MQCVLCAVLLTDTVPSVSKQEWGPEQERQEAAWRAQEEQKMYYQRQLLEQQQAQEKAELQQVLRQRQGGEVGKDK